MRFAACLVTAYLLFDMCDSPFILKDLGIPVPCGRCPPCKLRRVNQWVFRMMQEDMVSTSSHFVTLTYDTRYVPISKNGFMTLRKKDFQDYMKRLRKLCPDVKLKYYAVGEYGSQNQRPHFHAIIFNCPDTEMFYSAWKTGNDYFGSVHVGTVSSDSIAYTVKYLDKQTFTRRFFRDDRTPEFSLMSKGLGKSYISKATGYHRADISVMYVSKLDGHKVAMPRYYRQKIFTPDQLVMQQEIAQFAAIDSESLARERHAQSGDKRTFEEVRSASKRVRHQRFYHQSKHSRQ